jgi:hypothetical protein
MRSLIPKEDRGLAIEDVRDDIVVMREYDDQGAGSVHVRLLRTPWRDASNVTTLDEIDLAGVGGGDTWNPWPYARTNGRDVVWLRAGGVFAPHTIVLLGADRQKRTIYENSRAMWFDIDEAGRVAIAAEKEATQELVVYANGTTRQLGRRDGAAEGYPMSFGDVIGWTRGIGAVRLISDVELLPIAGGPSKAAPIPSGCVIGGRSLREIVTLCPAGVRLVDASTGTARDGPNSRVVQPWRRGLLWRTTADLTANPQVWRITLLA